MAALTTAETSFLGRQDKLFLRHGRPVPGYPSRSFAVIRYTPGTLTFIRNNSAVAASIRPPLGKIYVAQICWSKIPLHRYEYSTRVCMREHLRRLASQGLSGGGGGGLMEGPGMQLSPLLQPRRPATAQSQSKLHDRR